MPAASRIQAQINYEDLRTAICKGVAEGNAPLVAGLVATAEKRHDFRDAMQTNVDKVYQLDGEIKLLKGMMVSLMGTGDGSGGVVPRLERDMSKLGTDMASITAEMKEVRSDVSSMKDDVKAIRDAQTKQENWSSEVKGGTATGKWLIGMAITVISGVISAMAYLFSHGIVAK
jgi:hypothetical protein